MRVATDSPPSLEARRQAARDDYREHLSRGIRLTGADLARRHGMSERWGRDRVAETRIANSGDGSSPDSPTNGKNGSHASGNDPTPARASARPQTISCSVPPTGNANTAANRSPAANSTQTNGNRPAARPETSNGSVPATAAGKNDTTNGHRHHPADDGAEPLAASIGRRALANNGKPLNGKAAEHRPASNRMPIGGDHVPTAAAGNGRLPLSGNGTANGTHDGRPATPDGNAIVAATGRNGIGSGPVGSGNDGTAATPNGRADSASQRRITTAAVIVVALVAAAASYDHQRTLAELAGEGWRSLLFPLSVDGLLTAATMLMLTRRRAGQRAGALTWVALTLGVTASVMGNVIGADPTLIDPVLVGRLVAAWPPVALFLSLELLMRQLGMRQEGDHR